MIDLENAEEIKKLDPKDVFGSTGKFADQCQQIVDEYFDNTLFTDNYQIAKNIVIAGMGGSAYGAHIAQSLYPNELPKPLLVHSDYELPAFVNEESIVLLTSYSGSTEEVLSAAQEAKKRNAKVIGFSSGGKLGDFLKTGGYAGFTFDPKNNPSGQPRLGTGYIVTGTLVVLKSLGLIQITKQDLQTAINETKDNQNEIKQKAQEIAKALVGFMPVILASQHLVGNAHIIRNQFNETSKSFSAFEDVPELNHHLMEGLTNPTDKKLKMLLLGSDFYGEKHTKRMEVTKDVIQQNNTEVLQYNPTGSTKLAQVLNTLSFGGYVTLYLALLYGQDPSLIPWVDYFKEKLAK